MPHISLSEEVDAAERWSIEIDGRVHVARQISRPAIIRWLADIAAAGTNAVRQEQALHRVLREAFPAKWRYVWQGDPVLTILNLGIQRREEVLESFFAFALPSETTAGPKTMSGPSERRSSSVGTRPSAGAKEATAGASPRPD